MIRTASPNSRSVRCTSRTKPCRWRTSASNISRNRGSSTRDMASRTASVTMAWFSMIMSASPRAFCRLVFLTKKPARLATRRPFDLILARLDLHQRASRGRALRPAAIWAARLRLSRQRSLAGAGQLLRFRRDGSVDEFETDLVLVRIVLNQHDAHVAATLQLAEQDLVGERLLDVLLDHARHRPRTHLLVVAVLDQPGLGRVGQFDGDVAVGELCLELK